MPRILSLLLFALLAWACPAQAQANAFPIYSCPLVLQTWPSQTAFTVVQNLSWSAASPGQVNVLFAYYSSQALAAAGTVHGMRYEQLTAVLAKAIQEQPAEINRLAKRKARL